MRTVRLVQAAMILMAFFLIACGMTAEQAAAVEYSLREMHRGGTLTPEELAAALTFLEESKSGGIDWEVAGLFVVNLVAAIFGAPYIVQKMRGPITNRKGLAPAAPSPEALAAKLAEKAKQPNA